MNGLLQQIAPQRIGVFRALQLGDLLCALPALRALRAAAPRAHITLMGLPWSAAFVQRYPAYLDAHLAYPAALPLDAGPALDGFVMQAKACRFDLCLQLHGSGELSNPLLARIEAPVLAGFHPAAAAPGGLHGLPWQAEENERLRWLRLLRHLGADARGLALEFPIQATERREAAALLAASGLREPYVILHAGARLRSRRWPVSAYARVGRRLLDCGYALLLSGSPEEQPLTQALQQALHGGGAVIDGAGRSSLGVLAALMQRAQLLICNDTGVSHLAAAIGTPSVVISCGGSVLRWAPLEQQRHRVLAQALPCRPCLHDDCPLGHECALAITPDRVIDAALCQLQAESHAALA